MIKITEKTDLKRLLSYPKAYDYISKLLEDLLCDYSEYCADCSIRAIGAIYFMECLKDFEDYKALGLEQSLQDTSQGKSTAHNLRGSIQQSTRADEQPQNKSGGIFGEKSLSVKRKGSLRTLRLQYDGQRQV